jgi:hypothetical protein
MPAVPPPPGHRANSCRYSAHCPRRPAHTQVRAQQRNVYIMLCAVRISTAPKSVSDLQVSKGALSLWVKLLSASMQLSNVRVLLNNLQPRRKSSQSMCVCVCVCVCVCEQWNATGYVAVLELPTQVHASLRLARKSCRDNFQLKGLVHALGPDLRPGRGGAACKHLVH